MSGTTSNMGVIADLRRFRVTYPNGARIINARTAEEAAQDAQTRWGTPPARVEEIKEA
ncbi:hypothetical protein [Agromyces sp. NPDC058104]|uniref:hypothetical protein n=1 Tax=Agromyces sp. NPDC058104 TaxID=3346342 RepID=UPI0036DC317E